MESVSSCSQCSALLDPSNFAAHHQRFHLWRQSPQWTCANCRYASLVLPDAIAHICLEGHSLNTREKLPDWSKLSALVREDNSIQTSVITSVASPVLATDDYLKDSHEFPKDDLRKCADKKEMESLSVSLESSEPTNMNKLQCRKCKWSTSTERDQEILAVRHVRNCHNIRPYACSSCTYLATRKDYVKEHIKVCGKGAKLVTVDEDRNEAAIRRGLRQSFPTLKCRWRVI